MKTPYYTNCTIIGDNVLYRGINKDGYRESEKVPYKPSLFILNTNNTPTKYSTIDGKQVCKIEFESISAAREFVETYSKVDNFEIFGNTQYQYAYIGDNNPEDIIEHNIDDILIAYLDIETSSKNGFPEPETPTEPVTAITVTTKHKGKTNTHVFGCKQFTSSQPNLTYYKSIDEQSLLQNFIKVWSKLYPDIVSGWNINFFDIPYLVRRIDFVLGDKESRKLSPWGRVQNRKAFFAMKEREVFEIYGISILDYIDLYKKYSPKGTRESYKLDFISRIELNEGKTEYEGSLDDLYERDFQKYIEYNIQDVTLIDKLEDKMKLIQLAIGLAYDTKTNYPDVFSQVRMVETSIFNFLKKRNQVIPQKKVGERENYPGGYVKEPAKGMKKWVVSMDATSLYPHLQAQYNISPETRRQGSFKSGITIDDLLNKKVDTSFLKSQKLTMAANGHCYSIEKRGFLPEILMTMFEQRKVFKQKMIEKQKELQEIEAEITRRKNAQYNNSGNKNV